MKNEEIDRLLKLAFLTRESTLTDTEFIEAESKIDPEEFRLTSLRLRRRFISELFREEHPDLIRQLETKCTLGIWLVNQRGYFGLDSRELASAMDVSPELLRGLETGQIKPWETRVDLFFQIMKFMRLHFESLAVLVRNSVAASSLLGINSAQARCHGGKMTDVRGDAVSKALEMFKVHNADPVQDRQAEDWLSSLRTHLLAAKDELVM